MRQNSEVELRAKIERLIRQTETMHRQGMVMTAARDRLTSDGVPADIADALIGAVASRSLERYESAIRHLKWGIPLFVIGLLLTIGTYAAAGPGDGYYVFYGAIAVGAVRLVIGLALFFTSSTIWSPSNSSTLRHSANDQFERERDRHRWDISRPNW